MANETKKKDEELVEEVVDKKTTKADAEKAAKIESLNKRKSEIEAAFEAEKKKAQEYEQDIELYERLINAKDALKGSIAKLDGMRKEYTNIVGELNQLQS